MMRIAGDARVITLDASFRFHFGFSSALLGQPIVRLTYALAFTPLVITALMYAHILLFRFTPAHLPGNGVGTSAGAADVAACFHINTYLCSRYGRVLKTAIRALASLGILILVLGKAAEALLVKALPQCVTGDRSRGSLLLLPLSLCELCTSL